MRKQMTCWTVACIAAASSAASAQPTLYVDDDAPFGGDGSSWPRAFNDLNDAVILTGSLPPPVIIRIAGGTYRARVTGYFCNATFRLVDGVSLVGAYRGLAPG